MKWVNEAFLHEFGHFVHLTYLPREAREAWDAGWVEVKNQQEIFADAFQSITESERSKFFDILMFSKWHLPKAIRRISDPVQQVKFGIWLRGPLTGGPLITPKQFRWTKDAKPVVAFFMDRKQYMADNYDWIPEDDEDYERQLARLDKRFKAKLGLDWGGKLPIPQAAVESLSKTNPTVKKMVEEAMDKLEIVSDYGRKNEMEDFAESFVAFVGAPSKLTPTAKFRMQRALSLANFYNKPVMRLSHRVAARYLQEFVATP